MFRFIKTAIAKQLAKNLPGLTHVLSQQKVKQLQARPNTTVAKEVFFGEGSTVNIQGQYKELTIGKDVYFRNFCNILLYPDATLIVGEKVFFNNYCSINCLSRIEIGSGTSIGEGVKFYDHNHRYHYDTSGNLVLERDNYTYGDVKIGKNCWIGSNVTFLKGVEVGDNSIIGAHCLIHKSIPAGSVVKHTEELVITTGK